MFFILPYAKQTSTEPGCYHREDPLPGEDLHPQFRRRGPGRHALPLFAVLLDEGALLCRCPLHGRFGRLRDGACRHRRRAGSHIRRTGGHDRPLSGRRPGHHHLLRLSLRHDGARHLLQGPRDRPEHASAHAETGLLRHPSLRAHRDLHHRVRRDPDPLSAVLPGLPVRDGLLPRRLQCHIGLQQLRLLPLFGQLGPVPGRYYRQPYRHGAYRHRRDRLCRDPRGLLPAQGEREEAFPSHEARAERNRDPHHRRGPSVFTFSSATTSSEYAVADPDPGVALPVRDPADSRLQHRRHRPAHQRHGPHDDRPHVHRRLSSSSPSRRAPPASTPSTSASSPTPRSS